MQIAAEIYAPLLGLLAHALLQPFIWIGLAAEWCDQKVERMIMRYL
jgi:hypothetical protein